MRFRISQYFSSRIVASTVSGLILLSMILLLTRTYTIALSPDSVNYFSMASNLAFGNGFRNYAGDLPTAWPPLYTLLLAGTHILTGTDVLVSALLINLAIAFLIGFLAFLVFEEYFGFHIAIVGSVLVIFSQPLLHVLTYMWTEPLYALLSFLLLIVLKRFAMSRSRRAFILAVVLASAAALTRYIGVINIALLGLVIIYVHRQQLRRAIFYAVLSCAVASVPLLVWMYRNYTVDGTFLGPRFPSIDSFTTNIERAIRTILYWFVPERLFDQVPLILLIPVGVLIVFFFISLFREHEANYPFLFWIGVSFCFAYTVFLVWSSTRYAYDAINSRLLSPINIPLIIVVLHVIFHVVSRTRTQKLMVK